MAGFGAVGKSAQNLGFLMATADASLLHVIDDSAMAQLLAIGGDASDFDDTTDSLEAISNAISAIPGGTCDAFLASVGGLLTTAAATGAVGVGTTLMGYEKQIVTAILDGTYGLSALQVDISGIPTTMVGTNSSFLESVGGLLTTVAATGAVDTATPMMGYMKQVVNFTESGGATNVPQFVGTLAYADASASDDTGSGLTPSAPKKTIAAAQVVAGIGGAVTIKAGTYAEDVAMSYAAQELWPEIGTVFDGTGPCITISAANCKLGRPGDRFQITPAADQIGVVTTAAGTGSFINGAMVVGSASAGGFDINGSGAELHWCRATGMKAGAKAFDSSVSQFKWINCSTTGNTTSYGFYAGGATISRGLILNCTSVGHQTSGFYLDTGVSLITVNDCSSGGGDGGKVDSGTNNMWGNFVDRLNDEHHEHIYPRCTGQGAAGNPISVANATTDGAGGTRDDQDYWGDVATIIPMSTITTIWNAVGVYIHANTASDIQQWDIFFPRTAYSSAQNGGNDWDENETALTVADGTIFEDGDFVWITGTDRAAGEIVKVSGAPAGNVVTIARETTADAEAGLRYNYDGTPGANTMYVASRPGTPSLHRIEGDFSAATTRDMKAYRWHEAREMPPNTGMIMRMLNATDGGASSFDTRAIYED